MHRFYVKIELTGPIYPPLHLGIEMIIINANIITWGKPNQILENQAIVISDGVINRIIPTTEISVLFPEEEILDAHGQYVMPGNICAHTHFYGAFSRGMAIPGSSPANFLDILQKLWWPLDKVLDEKAIRFSALVCLIDAIKHGTTTLIDHHASPNAIQGSLDVIAKAVVEAGVRASLCYEVTDRNGIEGAKAGIEENVRFLKYIQNENQNGLLSGLFGLHASITLSDETLERCRSATPEGTGFHLHVAEDAVDEEDSLKRFGKRIIPHLRDFGMLGPKTMIAHGVHLDELEMDLLSTTGSWVSTQPRSNMNNAVGIASVEKMIKLGIPVCIGNDGFSNAMWNEWKMTYLVQKLQQHDPRVMPADLVIQMGVYNNARFVNSIFNCAPVGSVEIGAAADLILVDYHPYTPLTTGNLPWQIIFGFDESMVTTTIVNGKVLMRNRELLTLDEEKITAEARSIAPEIWARYNAEFMNRG